jgi:Ca2+-binding EF-hand superfamily protein
MLTKMKLALAMCAALGGVAAAQGAKADKPDWKAKKAEMLAKYDTNKDGKLDAAERKVMIDDLATAEFQKIDTNKDGVITLDELKAYKEAMPRHARGGFHRHHRMVKDK